MPYSSSPTACKSSTSACAATRSCKSAPSATSVIYSSYTPPVRSFASVFSTADSGEFTLWAIPACSAGYSRDFLRHCYRRVPFILILLSGLAHQTRGKERARIRRTAQQRSSTTPHPYRSPNSHQQPTRTNQRTTKLVRDVCCFEPPDVFRNEQTIVGYSQIHNTTSCRRCTNNGVAGCEAIVRVLRRVSAVVSRRAVGVKSVYILVHVTPEVFNPTILNKGMTICVESRPV